MTYYYHVGCVDYGDHLLFDIETVEFIPNAQHYDGTYSYVTFIGMLYTYYVEKSSYIKVYRVPRSDI